MEQEADWIWVSDDDAYLKDDALKQASDYLEEQPDLDKISAICGKVIKNGKNGSMPLRAIRRSMMRF